MRKVKENRNGLLPNSLKIISSCLKTVSANATVVASTVRSAGASVAASISVPEDDKKDQVLWAGFDKLEISSSTFKRILLLGYHNGFQVIDVEDSSDIHELVSKRDGPVTFLQMQPTPGKPGVKGFRSLHPLLLVVAGDETHNLSQTQGGHLRLGITDSSNGPQTGTDVTTPTVVRFYSLKSQSYVHVLRFRSAVHIVRCSPRIIAVALAEQIYCFDAVTLENKFSVTTYPMQFGGTNVGVNIGYGPMAVGPRWLAYASNNRMLPNMGRLSPQNLTPSPGVSPSTSPGNGSLVARYAMESSKHLAAGIINLSDMGYKTLSKYCQDLLPDGSNSPVSSNSNWKSNRFSSPAHSSELDNAGIVVIKDFVSDAVISQFRAHSSPISALCFDPSGTILVTASVHGNNINVFRIMPSRLKNDSNSASYDWSSCHVQLYRLYRGITTAVIQDICFSHYSQWITIVSSRGTCHIFLLSPFGGDCLIQPHCFNSDETNVKPSLSLPWWRQPTCTMNQKSFPPPSPVTLSVVSRIKNGSIGWLNTVSMGKISAPSGAMCAVFHNSLSHSLHPNQMKSNQLEHLMVYSPSGHLVQYELFPSQGLESCISNSRTGSMISSVPTQDEELSVKVEPSQWWDVCRRSNWPEREDCISSATLGSRKKDGAFMDISQSNHIGTKYMMPIETSPMEKDSAKSNGRPHWYLSNAEVQVSSGRIPLWQKSKFCFYVMTPPETADKKVLDDYNCGEIEIEVVPVHEVETRRKDLLPVFEHFHCTQSDWIESFDGGRHSSSSTSLICYQTEDKFMETAHRYTKLTCCSSVERSESGELCSLGSKNLCALEPTLKETPNNSIGSNMSTSSITKSLDLYQNIPQESPKHASTQNLLGFARCFNESYCKVSELDECNELSEVINDADSSSSHCDREKNEEDGDNDDMLGGVFAFSEEG